MIHFWDLEFITETPDNFLNRFLDEGLTSSTVDCGRFYPEFWLCSMGITVWVYGEVYNIGKIFQYVFGVKKNVILTVSWISVHAPKLICF